MYDFSKFSFKLGKEHADILKKYIKTDFQNDLVTKLVNVAIIIDMSR